NKLHHSLTRSINTYILWLESVSSILDNVVFSSATENLCSGVHSFPSIDGYFLFQITDLISPVQISILLIIYSMD
ncbi:hypothetical protein, partial [Escherichia coli]|uniref:hypothetical protein n=1 Tax=Escherichia coli TaxID=562 RepID=UPI001BB0A57D